MGSLKVAQFNLVTSRRQGDLAGHGLQGELHAAIGQIHAHELGLVLAEDLLAVDRQLAATRHQCREIIGPAREDLDFAGKLDGEIIRVGVLTDAIIAVALPA